MGCYLHHFCIALQKLEAGSIFIYLWWEVIAQIIQNHLYLAIEYLFAALMDVKLILRLVAYILQADVLFTKDDGR